MKTEDKTEAPKPFLAIATRSFKGVVRGARIKGMANPAFVKTRKVAHVGMFEYREVLDRKKSVTKTMIFEVENLAEFDGPTCEDACRAFISMLSKCTRSSTERCKADKKEAPIKLWRKLDFVQRVEANQ